MLYNKLPAIRVITRIYMDKNNTNLDEFELNNTIRLTLDALEDFIGMGIINLTTNRQFTTHVVA